MGVIVQTSKGKLQGVEEAGLAVFRGIPFAEPPVGRLRFRAPQEAAPWTAVRDASRFGARAIQVRNEALEALLGKPEGMPPLDEDCLTLNVWTPGLDGRRRPVMVWIHGGGFMIGSGCEPLYDGTALAARDVVVVTINYRLGPLGFLYVRGFASCKGDPCANFGILDQIAALQWVRSEIASFGGDPANVTIFGESAGAFSIGALLGSPLAGGLFHKAILQSGASHQALTRKVATKGAKEFAAALGMLRTNAAALRARPAADLTEAQARLEAESGWASRRALGLGLRYQPVIDSPVIPDLPIELVRAGSAKGVPVLVGTTRDEYKLFATMVPGLRRIDEDEAAKRISLLLPRHDIDRARWMLHAYSLARRARGDSIDPYEILCAAVTDWVFRVPADRLAEARAEQHERVFAYRLDWQSPLGEGILGACHAVDLPFVFGTHRIARRFVGRGDDVDALAKLVGDAWVAFARNGDPSAGDLRWPEWDTAARKTLVLDQGCRVEMRPREPERLCWNGIVP